MQDLPSLPAVRRKQEVSRNVPKEDTDGNKTIIRNAFLGSTLELADFSASFTGGCERQ